MVNSYPASEAPSFVQVLRHAEVKKRLKVSSAKLFDMVAKGQFPKPFKIVPGGRAVGWLESDVDEWVLDRKANLSQEGA
jgi:prophage regulatory protein